MLHHHMHTGYHSATVHNRHEGRGGTRASERCGTMGTLKGAVYPVPPSMSWDSRAQGASAAAAAWQRRTTAVRNGYSPSSQSAADASHARGDDDDDDGGWGSEDPFRLAPPTVAPSPAPVVRLSPRALTPSRSLGARSAVTSLPPPPPPPKTRLRPANAPLTSRANVQIAVDASAGVPAEQLERMREAVLHFVNNSLGDDDAVGLLSFGGSLAFGQRLSRAGESDLGAALASMPLGGPARLWDAMVAGLDELEAARPTSEVYSMLVREYGRAVTLVAVVSDACRPSCRPHYSLAFQVFVLTACSHGFQVVVTNGRDTGSAPGTFTQLRARVSSLHAAATRVVLVVAGSDDDELALAIVLAPRRLLGRKTQTRGAAATTRAPHPRFRCVAGGT